MANAIRCDICQGKKQILSLGNLQKDCYECHGIGWLQPDEDEPIVKPKKKKKPKFKDDEILHCQTD